MIIITEKLGEAEFVYLSKELTERYVLDFANKKEYKRRNYICVKIFKKTVL